jgi:hypothetical protein
MQHAMRFLATPQSLRKEIVFLAVLDTASQPIYSGRRAHLTNYPIRYFRSHNVPVRGQNCQLENIDSSVVRVFFNE